MRHNVARAITEVRKTFESAKRWRMRPGDAWEHARTLADEVERLHARIKRMESEQEKP